LIFPAQLRRGDCPRFGIRNSTIQTAQYPAILKRLYIGKRSLGLCLVCWLVGALA